MSYITTRKNRFKLTPCVYLILVKDGKILLHRRKDTGYEDGNYGLVAGHLEGNEPATEAMCREAAEESGVNIKSEDLKFAHVMHRRDNDERLDIFYMADKWEGEPKNMEPEKCDDLSWFPLDNLPANTIPYIKRAIENFQNGIYYSEYGWEK